MNYHLIYSNILINFNRKFIKKIVLNSVLSKQGHLSYITTEVCSLRYVAKRPRDFCDSQISLGLLQKFLGLSTARLLLYIIIIATQAYSMNHTV